MSTITLTEQYKRTLVATIHLDPDSDVRVYQNWGIQLVSPDRVLDLPLDPPEQARWWQYHYVQTLIDNDVPDQEILAAIKAIRQVDAENDTQDEAQDLQRDLTAAEQRMRAWCIERGLNYDELSEEQIAKLADEAIAAWRKKDYRG
jgi:hypothetical protein